MMYDAVCVARGVVRGSRQGARVDVVQSCEIFVFRGQGRMLRIILPLTEILTVLSHRNRSAIEVEAECEKK